MQQHVGIGRGCLQQLQRQGTRRLDLPGALPQAQQRQLLGGIGACQVLCQPLRLHCGFVTAALARQRIAQRHAQCCVVGQLHHQRLQHRRGVGVFAGSNQQLGLHAQALAGALRSIALPGVDVRQGRARLLHCLAGVASCALAFDQALLVVAIQGQQLRLLRAAPLQLRQQEGQALRHASVVLRAVQQCGVVQLHGSRQRAGALLQPVKHGHAQGRLVAFEPGVGHGIQQAVIVLRQGFGALQQVVRSGRVGCRRGAAGLCDQLVHRGTLHQRLHPFAAAFRGHVLHVLQCSRVVVQGAANERAGIAHGRLRRGLQHAIVHGAEGFAGQAQAHIQPCQAVAHPCIARRQRHCRFQGAQCCAGALCLQKVLGLLLQEFYARVEQLVCQAGVARHGLFQQGQRLARLAAARVDAGQAPEGRAVARFALQSLFVQGLGFGQGLLQGARAGQGVERLGAVGLQGQRLARQAVGGGQFILVQGNVHLAQQALQLRRRLQLCPALLARQGKRLACQLLRLGVLALAHTHQCQAANALHVARAQCQPCLQLFFGQFRAVLFFVLILV